ncbi:MAG TPA: M20/M25/M40 family metallo-hydrolase, partial [Gemmatimonadaceae bacterium]|nr:M20/M25/M40 family metallo-hydrolase [Gemmatimonadaceae bacterium]
KSDLQARLRENLAAERDLRARGEASFAPIAAEVRDVVAEVSKTKLYDYQDALFRFDSKHMTKPGNVKAAEYLFNTLKSFGYEPEYQWFEPMPGVRTANVVARLQGTTHPELVYVVGSHYDSVEDGPGADDDTSGTAVLLETARVMKDHPRSATVLFVFYTGEESGLRGSREFTRRAVADGMQVVGALNNDMFGWSNDHRIDNTIRYSNPRIRDIQHAGAFLYSKLVTYDARYYKNTDAHALFDAFGDVIGGIGSYPVLGNPHYHQSHDLLETINQEQVYETTRATLAALMGMVAGAKE